MFQLPMNKLLNVKVNNKNNNTINALAAKDKA